MLALVLMIYGATWLLAAVCAALIETLRLLRLRPLPPPLDLTGALAMAWVAAPVMAPLVLVAGVRGFVRRWTEPKPSGRAVR